MDLASEGTGVVLGCECVGEGGGGLWCGRNELTLTENINIPLVSVTPCVVVC